MPSEFSSRAILITGANGGLGRAVVKTFIEAGAMVVAVYRGGAPPEGGLRFAAIEEDLTDPAGAARVVEAAVARAGRLDALIHLVGGFAGGQPVSETSDATWRQMLDLNLNAAFYTIRAALPPVLAAGRGRIIAVGSRTALEPAAALSAYGVSKAGLVALIRTLALELKGTNVTANAVLPSVIDTPANRVAMPGADFSRWVAPEAIAQLILWLASDAAATVNGAAVPIYGAA